MHMISVYLSFDMKYSIPKAIAKTVKNTAMTNHPTPSFIFRQCLCIPAFFIGEIKILVKPAYVRSDFYIVYFRGDKPGRCHHCQGNGHCQPSGGSVENRVHVVRHADRKQCCHEYRNGIQDFLFKPSLSQ